MRLLELAVLAGASAHECFNCNAGGECLHFGNCSEYTGLCECPPGFGGANCKQPVCGSLAQGDRRALRPENTTCVCSDGWDGVNCNMCSVDAACEPFMPGPDLGDARCYAGGVLVDRNFHSCTVTNRKVNDVLAGKHAEATFGCSRESASCDFQLWIDAVESFYCQLSDCAFNGLDYECTGIQCACQPGELLCGKEGSIDISEWLEKSVKGPGNLDCDQNGQCRFQEPAMNQLVQFVFGDRSIELDCSSSECLHYSQVPGYAPPEKPRASLITILSTVLTASGIFGVLAYFFRRLGQSDLVNLKQAPQLAGEEPIARTAPVGLYFENIAYRTASSTAAPKEILSGISGAVPPGHVLAILGGSGAGKTTLLDILAAKYKKGTVEGRVLLNGTVLTEDSPLRKLVGFVDQSDSTLIPTQTVYEHVMFSALLRLPRTMSLATKELRALDTLQELGIAHLRHQMVGKGLSGGERRRLAIACELVTSPSILLLDEPTSGLDAYNAFAVVETLVNLAKNANRTIVFTIHQPRSNIVSLFDRIMLLARGQLVYTGSVRGAEDFFEAQGHKVPPNFNFADHIVDVSMKAAVAVPGTTEPESESAPVSEPVESENTMDGANGDGVNGDGINGDGINGDGDNEGDLSDVLSDVSGESAPDPDECPDPKVHTMPLGTDAPREWNDFAFHRAQISRSSAQAMANSQISLGPQGLEPLVTAYRNSPSYIQIRTEIEQAQQASQHSGLLDLHASGASLVQQFTIISLRLFRNLYRDPMLIITHYGISLGLGVLCGYLYFDVSNDIPGFQNRLGLFFFLLAVFGFSTLTTVSLFGRERLVFMRERANGYYHPFAYYAAKLLLDIVPLRLGPPVLLGLIVYPLVGLNSGDHAPLVFLLVLALFNLSAATLILVIGIFFADFGVASLLGCMVNLFGILFAGLFLNQESMPRGSGWLKYLSIYHFAYEALSVNEVKYLTLSEEKFGLKIEVPGAAILSAFGFDNTAVFRDVIGLIVAALLCVVAGYIVLHKVLVERR